MGRSIALPLTLAASLVVPGVLAAGGLWLQFREVDRARDETRRMAVATLGDVEREVRHAWRAALTDAVPGTFVVEVDPRGQATSPFAPWPGAAPATPAEVPLALSLARHYAAAEQFESAVAFYRQVGIEALMRLDPLEVLAWARTQARVDRAAARALLGRAERHAPSLPVPFAVLAGLTEARLAAEDGDADVARRLRRELAATPEALPAEAVAPVMDALAAYCADDEPAEVAALRGAADLVQDPDLQRDFAESAVEHAGCLWITMDRGVGVMASSVARGIAQRVLAAADARVEGLSFALRARQGDEARLEIDGLGVLSAATRGTALGTRLQQLASVLLVLAGVAFVCGNVVMFVVVRRELALSRMKSEFVDLVSHELRTPLSALSLKTEMLAEGAVPAERRPRYLRTLHREVGRLGVLVARVLDFARLERGRAALRMQRTPARDLLARALREVRWTLPVAGRVRVDAARGLPDVSVDSDVIVQALRNLIENALELAPEGTEVTLAAECVGSTLSLSVADAGPGVPRGERAKIFEPFQRGSTAVGEGSGLGLAIASRAAAAHRGMLTCEPNRPQGSVFTLRLPTASREASA